MKSQSRAPRGAHSDNQRPFWPLKLVVAISLSLTTLIRVDASVMPNNANEQQQLTDDKSTLLRPISANNNNNNLNRYQQVNGALNDLVEKPEAQTDSNKQRWVPAAQANPLKRLVGHGGGVINGNHATYVEPPADFKPIIYDSSRQEAPVQSVPNEHSDFYPNQFKPQIAGSDLSSAQQQQQQQPQDQLLAGSGAGLDPLMISSSGFSDFPAATNPSDAPSQHRQHQQRGNKKPSLAGAFPDEISASALKADRITGNQDRLKPSIGRWSDWHDMSIEPDLASSDGSTSFQSARAFGAVNLPAAPYKTRYRAVAAIRDATVQRVQSEQSVYGADAAARDQIAGEAVGAALAGHQKSVKRQTSALVQQPQQQLQIKGGQQAAEQSSLATGGSQPIKGTKLPLKLISNGDAAAKQSLKLARQNNQRQLLKEFNNEQHNQQAPSLQQQRPDGFSANSQAGDSGSVKQPRRLKRRRKSKTNTEVRIQQLVADSQQKQQQQQQDLIGAAKQVNGLAAVNQEQQVDQEKEPRSIHQQPGASEAHRQQVKQQQWSPAKQQVAGERVPSKQLVVQHQRPLVLRKLSGSSSQQPNSTNPKQVPRVRRIKTLLPVGLSSWFLGGIRDLDGRHWQLPAEVINRLAVNDVDFVGSGLQTTIKPVVAPAAGSVLIIEPQQQAGVPIVGEPLAPAIVVPGQRVPINKLVPRRR